MRYDNIAFKGTNPVQYLGNATITVCTSVGTGLPCTPLATTYTDATLSTPCPAGDPVVLAGTSTCVATADTLGNFGFWVAPNSTYIYTVTAVGFPGYSTTITAPCPVAGSCSFSNLNNIRIVDGTHFAQSAAGINAANADLGSGVGEIWVPSNTVTATDAQISISASHTLKVFGVLKIDAVNKGPILLGSYASLICSGNGGDATFGTIANTAAGTMPSMVRGIAQNGTQETMYVEGCNFNGQGATVSRGIIDVTGQNDKFRISRNLFGNYNGGHAIYADDSVAGVSSETGNGLIIGNWFAPPPGNGLCVKLTTGTTNNIQLDNIQFIDNECTSSAAVATTPVSLINASGSSTGLLNGIYIDGFRFYALGSLTVPALTINGVYSGTFRNVACNQVYSDCIKILNSANNASLIFDGITNTAGSGNTINDVGNSQTYTQVRVSYTPNNIGVPDYIGQFLRLRSASVNPASGGIISLANTDQIKWRNAGNSNDDVLQDNSGVLAWQPNTGTVYNVILDNLSQTLTNKTLTAPAITNPTITTGGSWAGSPTLTTATLTGLTNGTGLQFLNTSTTCTTGASIGATCTTGAISLPVAEADTAYRVVCTGKGVTNVPVVIATTNSSGTQFTITIAALTAAAASFASYDCIVGHN